MNYEGTTRSTINRYHIAYVHIEEMSKPERGIPERFELDTCEALIHSAY